MASKEEKPEGEENAEATAEGADGKKKGGLKKILIIVVPILLLVGGGAGAYFMGYLDSLLGIEKAEEGDEEHAEGEEGAEGEHGEEKHGEEKEDGHKEEKKEGGHGAPAEGGHGKEGEGGAVLNEAFLAIPTMIVNLNSEDGNPRYLRLTVQLELDDPSQRAEVEGEIPRVIDQFQTYLRELRVQDLRGSAGIYRLQVELLWRVNQAVHPIEIKDVLFQEILIQ